MRHTAKIARITPIDCTSVRRSPKKAKAITVTETSWMTADRLKAAAIPNSRTSRSMMRFPAEYKNSVSANFHIEGVMAHDFAMLAAKRNIAVEIAS